MQGIDPISQGLSTGPKTLDPTDEIVSFINEKYDLQEVDHRADAHLIPKRKPGATICGLITVHRRTFNAHPSVRRCKKCLQVGTTAAKAVLYDTNG